MDDERLLAQARRMLGKTTTDLEASWAMGEAEREERIALFHRSAREFCDFIDEIEKGEHPRLYADLLRLLTLLAAAGLALPPCGEGGEAEYDGMRLRHEEWKRVGGTVGRVTAPAVKELTADAAEDDPDARRAEMLWDDLADVYRDLRSALRIYELGTEDARAEAAWQWRFGYESHWGAHLFSALQTVHEIRFRLFGD
ncbi:MAG: DUF5063 domain-containing protein [Planctomycetota bacterium]|jgi:hypothetical protein